MLEQKVKMLGAGEVVVTGRFAALPGRPLHVEAELDDVAVGHDVVLALHADLAGLLGLLHRAELHQVVEGDDLGLDEAALEVGVDDAGRLGRGRALADRPGAGLLGPGGEVGLQAEGVEADPGEYVEAGLVDAHLGQHRAGLVVVAELDQLGLELRVEEDRLGGRDELLHLRLELLVGQLVGVAVEDVDERLGRQQRQLADQRAVDLRGDDRRTGLEGGQGLTRGVEVGVQRLVAARLLLQPRDRLLDGLQVGEDQLGLDGRDVGGGVDLAVDVGDVLVAEHPGHLADRRGLADVGEELVAQALALRGTGDDAGDVDELDGRGQHLGAAEHLRELRQPVVGYADDADVGLDRRERVVRREHVVLGQGVEEGRLARVGETDDADGECHGPRVYGAGDHPTNPSASVLAPASPPRTFRWLRRRASAVSKPPLPPCGQGHPRPPRLSVVPAGMDP